MLQFRTWFEAAPIIPLLHSFQTTGGLIPDYHGCHAEYTALLAAMGGSLLEQGKHLRMCTMEVSSRRENHPDQGS